MKLRLQTLLIFPYLLLLATVAGVGFLLSTQDRDKAIAGLADHLLHGAIHHVAEHIDHLVKDAFQPLYLTRDMVADGMLSLGDEKALAAHLRRQVNSHPEAIALGVGTLQGRYTAYTKALTPGGVWYTDRIWRVNGAGETVELFSEKPGYDVRQDPAFQAGLRAAQRPQGADEGWSGILTWQLGSPVPPEDRSRVAAGPSGINAVLPLRDREGKLLGVAENALTLDQISAYLKKILNGSAGFSLLLDADGDLLAHSLEADGDDTPDQVLPELLRHLRGIKADDGHFVRDLSGRIDIGGATQFFRVATLSSPSGIEWRAVAVISEREVGSAIRDHWRRTLLLFAITLLGIGVLGWGLAAAISRPVVRLSQAATAVKDGDWNSPPAGGIAEVAELTDAIGQMVHRLDNSMLDLEVQVEQRTRELSESRRTIATLFANLPGMAYRCRNDRDWTMNLVSEGCHSLTGYQPADLIDNSVVAYNDLILREDQEQVWQEVQNALAERRPYRLDYRIRTKDYQLRWVWEQGQGVFDNTGQLVALEGFITDISQLKDTQFNLERARREAEAASRAKGIFLSNMSHEIRTPLNAILGFSELLAKRIEGREERESLEAIRISGNSLRALIDDILELSKMEAGKLAIERVPTDLRRLAHQMQLMFGQTAERQGIAFRLALAPDVPAALLLDENRLRQILLNLLGNAFKFTERGAVELRMRAWPAATAGESDAAAANLIIDVQDTGPGIPPEDQQRIFDPFEQRAQSPQGGTGLGLAIVKRLAQAMDGRISLRSRPGEGSCFSLELPGVLLADPPLDSEPLDCPDSPPVPAHFREATLVVADDLPINRRLLVGLLEELPFRLIETGDGPGTLAAVHEHRPDLLLLDMKMPGMSGQEVARALRSDPATRTLPIVAITALALAEEQREIESLCDAYITKPVDYRALMSVLARFLAVEEQ